MPYVQKLGQNQIKEQLWQWEADMLDASGGWH